MIPSLTIDLAQPPEKRWQLSAAQCEQARELLAFYRSDLALSSKMRQAIAEEVRRQVPSEYWAEFASLGRQLNLPVAEVAILNCYYDSLKVSMGNVFACTAFAVENANEILHARNLDWWTENGALSREGRRDRTHAHSINGNRTRSRRQEAFRQSSTTRGK